MKREDVRSITVIAYVDHGKTTLADQLPRQNGVFHANQGVQERVMGPNDPERERGITILPRNMAVLHKDTRINIIDTPGHADLGGEVERILRMVDGIVLVVDAYEESIPQTKPVLQKMLDLNPSVIVCINKIDRPEAGPIDAIGETLELMMDLDVTDGQLDCPFIYVLTKGGFAKYKIEDPEVDMNPLFGTIINHIPAPRGNPDTEIQVLVGTIDYNEFIGRTGTGRVDNEGLKMSQRCVLVNHYEPNKFKRIKIRKLHEFDGLERVEMQEAGIGSIVAISGITGIHIGDTICTPSNPESIPFQKTSEPATAVYFMVDDSPLVGQEGKFITSRHLCGRLFRELNTGVSLRVEETDLTDCFKVSGCGELHLSILVENIRHEGFEFAVSKAEVLYRYDERNRRPEPVELAYVDVSEGYTGIVIRKLTSRKGALQGMSQVAGGYSRLESSTPSRRLIDHRGGFPTNTKGNSILNAISDGYTEYKGDSLYRQTSSLIASKASETVTYGLLNTQERGALSIGSGVKVYSGMIVGQSLEAEDIEINVYKIKKLTSTRSSNADEIFRLTPPKIMSLERALDFADTDGPPEVTLGSPRIHKKILDPTLRGKAFFKNKQMKIDIL